MPDNGSPQRILLTGFMGAGKTTVGILLAELLGWRFLDLDQHVESHSGHSIASIFAEKGEPGFRALETNLLAGILGARDIVIALGGGALDSASNRAAVTTAPGTTLVFLDAPLATLLHRVATQQSEPNAPVRPLLSDAVANKSDAAVLHAARLPHYRAAALHIDTTKLDARSVTAQILSSLALETFSRPQDAP